jgi:hypothetical protein
MKLTLTREPSNDVCTFGILTAPSFPAMQTLEDVVRDVKIKGETAIPAGTYRVIINWSNRFKKHMPLLLDVPNFQGVRIHTGNVDGDTEGCILVGMGRGKNSIVSSRAAYDILFAKLQAALSAGNTCLITIQ